MKKIYFDPIFIFGFAVRLVLILAMAPLASSTWYIPFLDSSTSSLTLDPWSQWMESSGNIEAFPYGYVMWIFFLPGMFLVKLAHIQPSYGYDVTLLFADIALLSTLCKFIPGRERFLLGIYWLSPIVIVATYILGLNDLVPVLFLTLSIFFIRKVKLKIAGILLASAVSAKVSMIVALPFFVIYLYNNKSLRQYISKFILGFIFSSLIILIPFFYSHAIVQMIFHSSEIEKIYYLVVDLGGDVFVYIIPLIYMGTLYLVWRIRRFNFELFQATTGLVFLLIALMTPNTLGWFVWCMPFLVLYQAVAGGISVLLVSFFSLTYVIVTLLVKPLFFANGLHFDLSQALVLTETQSRYVGSMAHTAMIGSGLILTFRMWRESISRNDFFRLSRKPFALGVAGDSGSGKDTFIDAISELFGKHSVVKLSGDDYHLWDRKKPMWQVLTHLNPMVNDLEKFCNDLVSLVDGKSISSRFYDHTTGKMGRLLQIESNDFILASGLHALYLPLLRDCYDLKIYLDIDEDLRRYYKIKRDVEERGHDMNSVMETLNRRASDSDKFIRPQLDYADIIFTLQPLNSKSLEDYSNKSPRLKLTVRTRNRFNENSLSRVLVGICGLHVDVSYANCSEDMLMTIDGDITAADVEMGAYIICPELIEFLDVYPRWSGGVLGLMQLITLSHISQILRKRFI